MYDGNNRAAIANLRDVSRQQRCSETIDVNEKTEDGQMLKMQRAKKEDSPEKRDKDSMETERATIGM